MTSQNTMGICRNSPDLLDNLSGAHSNHSGLREMIIHNPTEHGQATHVNVLTSDIGGLLFKDNGNGVPLCSTNPQEKCAKQMFNFGTQGMRMTDNNISRVGLGIFQSMIGNQGGLGRNAICISVWKSPNGHRECFVGFLARSFMDSIQTVSVPCVSFTFQATGEWTTHSSDICKLDRLKQTAEPELFSYLEGKKLSEAIKTQFPTTDDTGICWIVPKVYDTYNLSIEGDIINNGASLREVLRQALLPTKLPNFSMSIDGVQIDRTKHIAIQMERYPCYASKTHKSRDGRREMRISRCFTPKNSDLRVNGGRILVYHHGHFVCEKKGKKWGLEEEGHASQALIVVNQQFLTPNVVKNDFQDLDHMKDEQKWFNNYVRTHYKEIKRFGRLQRLAESSSDSDGTSTSSKSKKRAATSGVNGPKKKPRNGPTQAVFQPAFQDSSSSSSSSGAETHQDGDSSSSSSSSSGAETHQDGDSNSSSSSSSGAETHQDGDSNSSSSSSSCAETHQDGDSNSSSSSSSCAETHQDGDSSSGSDSGAETPQYTPLLLLPNNAVVDNDSVVGAETLSGGCPGVIYVKYSHADQIIVKDGVPTVGQFWNMEKDEFNPNQIFVLKVGKTEVTPKAKQVLSDTEYYQIQNDPKYRGEWATKRRGYRSQTANVTPQMVYSLFYKENISNVENSILQHLKARGFDDDIQNGNEFFKCSLNDIQSACETLL